LILAKYGNQNGKATCITWLTMQQELEQELDLDRGAGLGSALQHLPSTEAGEAAIAAESWRSR
jgi:hypothetical protein